MRDEKEERKKQACTCTCMYVSPSCIGNVACTNVHVHSRVAVSKVKLHYTVPTCIYMYVPPLKTHHSL